MPAPRHALFVRQEDFHLGRCALFPFYELHIVEIAPRGQPFAESLGLRDGGRQRGALHVRRDGLQSRQCQREEVTALAGRKGVHFVDNNAPEAGEQLEAVGIGKEQR